MCECEPRWVVAASGRGPESPGRLHRTTVHLHALVNILLLVLFPSVHLAQRLRFQFWVQYSSKILFVNIFLRPDAHSRAWPGAPGPGRLRTHFLFFSHFSYNLTVARFPSEQTNKQKNPHSPARRHRQFSSAGPADNYKERRKENDWNRVAHNGAGSQTVRKPFLPVTQPVLISIYKAAERHRRRRLARLACLW